MGGGDYGCKLCRAINRKMKTVRIVERQASAAERFIARLLRQRVVARLDTLRQRVDVLSRRAPDAHRDATLPVAALRPVVLREPELAHARLQHHTLQRAVAAVVSIADDEAEDVAVEADAALEIGDGENRIRRAQTQRLVLARAPILFSGRGAFSCRARLGPAARRCLPGHPASPLTSLSNGHCVS